MNEHAPPYIIKWYDINISKPAKSLRSGSKVIIVPKIRTNGYGMVVEKGRDGLLSRVNWILFSISTTTRSSFPLFFCVCTVSCHNVAHISISVYFLVLRTFILCMCNNDLSFFKDNELYKYYILLSSLYIRANTHIHTHIYI